MKKIAFIVPKGSKYGKNELLKRFLAENNVVTNFYGAWETPNLSLLTIASLVGDEYEVKFIDEDHGETVPFDESFDIVALTAMSQQINRAYEISETFRQKGSYVAIGGIHSTVLPQEVSKQADTIFIGEGEQAWLQFLKDYEAGKPKKEYFCDQYIDMKKSPVPRYEMLNPELYSSYSVQTTRGCPRTCNYCTLPRMFGNTFRYKSPQQIVDEIKAIKKVDPSPFVFFADDNMFIQREQVKKLLRELAKMNIVWGTQTDISAADDDELLKLLYEAGCHWLFIGFENISDEGLRILDNKHWKAKQRENYERSIERIHDHGINIWGSFMFGGDNDHQDVFEKTVQFSLTNGLYSGSFTVLTPLPGTPLFKQMEDAGRIIDYDWSRYTFWDVVFEPMNMTPAELTKGIAWVYNTFYSKENVKQRTGKIRQRLRKLARARQ